MPRGYVWSGSLLLLAVLMILPASAASLSVAMGDEVVITGTNPGGQTVYLFLAGPNLPEDGVRLTDGEAVVTGSASRFTRAEVLPDGTWRYAWDTRGVSGIIDPGAYTLFAVNQPAGRQDLKGTLYTSLGITLRKPGISVQTATPGPAQATPTVTQPSPATAGSAGFTLFPCGIAIPVPAGIPILACAGAILAFGRRRR